MINETNVNAHTHTQENKKWEIKTWEKWYWGIVEVLLIFFIGCLILFGIITRKPFDWDAFKGFTFIFVAGEIIFLIIWGITKLIIWLVNRNKKKIDN